MQEGLLITRNLQKRHEPSHSRTPDRKKAVRTGAKKKKKKNRDLQTHVLVWDANSANGGQMTKKYAPSYAGRSPLEPIRTRHTHAFALDYCFTA